MVEKFVYRASALLFLSGQTVASAFYGLQDIAAVLAVFDGRGGKQNALGKS